MKLFGTSGIRGLANTEISAELAINIGKVLGSLYKSVIVGHDPRTSSEMLLHAVISGLLSTGCEVHTAGMVTTPTLAHSARNFECGVMITASHNPPEYNGIKFFNPDGSGFNVEQMQQIEDRIEEKKAIVAKWEEIKGLNKYHGAVEEHIQRILKDIDDINLKIVVDCGCGAASNITPYLFQRLGCEVITLNCQPDGFFSARPSEPKPENLSHLMKAVVASKADLGLAHDGDADRVVAVDEKGNYVGGDSLLALFARCEAKKSIVVPVNASMAIDKVVGSVEVIRTKVGDVYISNMIKDKSADFGGEPSGTYIFPRQSLCPDGIFAGVRLAELVKKEPLSSQVSTLPKYPRKTGAVLYPGKDKSDIVRLIYDKLQEIEHSEMSTEDGIKAKFEHAWVLVRASGTEPKLRITVEAEDEGELKKLYDKIYNLVKGCASQ
jgi:phosphoglucosamine mutase